MILQRLLEKKKNLRGLLERKYPMCKLGQGWNYQCSEESKLGKTDQSCKSCRKDEKLIINLMRFER